MKYTVIDPHCHIIPHREPVWGWGPHFFVEELLETLDRGYDVMGEIKRVEKAIVMTSIGLTAVGRRTITESHQYALESIKKYPERIFLNPIINPRFPLTEQLDTIREWKDEYNVVMLKLHPSMHNYFLPTYRPYPGEASKKMIYPTFELARELDVPMMIHMGEAPYSFPAQIAPVAEAFQDVHIICAHSGANNVPSNALDAILLAKTHDNVYLGTSWVQTPELIEMYYALGAGKIIYESDCSPAALGQALRLVTNLHLPPPLGVGASKDEVYQMIGKNAADLCKIPL
jgi:predicted TIM-barrel fold metal-dependent hydrolase|tara:strand:+ start:1186 stop:2046 length:861 start_codon:yes stop_codon:yes gene_type:complete